MAPRPTTDSDPLLLLNTSLDLEDATRSHPAPPAGMETSAQDLDTGVEYNAYEYDGDNHLAVLTQMYGRYVSKIKLSWTS